MATKHFIIENLNKIIRDKELSKVKFAEIVGFEEAKWNKISNGFQNLNITDLSKIARGLKMREIDILTYPAVFVEKEYTKKERFFVAFEVEKEKRDYLLALNDDVDCKIVTDYKLNN